MKTEGDHDGDSDALDLRYARSWSMASEGRATKTRSVDHCRLGLLGTARVT